jgi:DNA polymerase/3'-5' exonuclease PolX
VELEKARAIAEELKWQLETGCDRVEIVGDIRRQKPEVRDINLLCIPTEGKPIPPDLRGWFDSIPVPGFEDTDPVDDEVKILMLQGVLGFRPKGRRAYGPKKKFMVHAPSGMGVDILSTDAQCWAVALVVTTGGDMTNKQIASAVRRKGWRFRTSEDGFDTADSHITCSTEIEVFEAVGLPYLPPEQRE